MSLQAYNSNEFRLDTLYTNSFLLYVGLGGDVRVLTSGGSDVTFKNVDSASTLPVQIRKVFSVGTTASSLIILNNSDTLGADNRFIMVVKSDNAGTSATNQFTIPTDGAGYLYDVSTDDGYTATGITGDHTITFPTGAGTHEVYISGDFPKIFFADGGDKLKLLEVTNWGTYGITQPYQIIAFRGCANLTQIAGGGAWFDVIINGFVMFVGVSLTSLPDDMTLPILGNGVSMFNNSGLEVLPSGMELPLVTSASGMFGNNPLTDLPTVMKLPSLTQGTNMFINVTINTTRYSQLLIDLESGNANNNVTFHGGNSKYNAAGEVARDALVARGWTITDGGLEL